MVLELKAPRGAEPSEFLKLWPSFAIYLVSFFRRILRGDSRRSVQGACPTWSALKRGRAPALLRGCILTVTQRYGLCACGTASEVDIDAEIAACPYCGDEMLTRCPHCESPLMTNGRFCRRCGEEVLRGTVRPKISFVQASMNPARPERS
jgi:predicted RNA-binding Zn-ribbon protein involved in translation (DUF1610 family)